MLSPIAIQAGQVLLVVVAAPFLQGVIARVEAMLQGRRGPRLLQPYLDLAKLFSKETLWPDHSTWVFLAAPVVAFCSYLVFPLLIPVLTTYGLPLGYIADIFGSGFVLALAAFAVGVAAAETGAPYAQLGSSRAMTFSALGEPSFLFIVFSVALVTATDLPYVEAATIRSSAAQMIRPAHLLAAAAFFLLLLAETGRIPIETHSGTIEFGMIDEARTLEHSGPSYALLKWGSAMKQMLLYAVFINVFLAPWGLASTGRPGEVVAAAASLVGKAVLLGVVIAVIDNSFAKLRLFKVSGFMAAAFLLAVLAIFALYLGGG